MDRRWTAARWGGRGGHSELSQQVGQDGQGGPSGITCPVACQSRVAPRPKSGFQAQCGGGLENPWVGTERFVPLNASADRLHLALERRRVHCFHPTLSARYRPGSSRGSARPPSTAPRMDQDHSSARSTRPARHSSGDTIRNFSELGMVPPEPSPLLSHPPVKVDRVGTSGSAKPCTKPGNYCTKSLTECNSALNEKSGPGID